MINEQITQGVVSNAKSQAKLVFDIIRFMSYSKPGNSGIKNLESGEVKLKDLVKTNSKLEKIEISDKDLKYIKKELKKDGVSFSIYFDKDTKKNYIYFQAKDIEILNLTFDKVLKKLKKREESKTHKLKSTLKEKIKKSKERFEEKVKEKVFDKEPLGRKL
ncbi:MAG: PcfB family protein [Parvimonas sp.]|uniref:PcfB family protein n=1 Tax=Parvimonas sp. TaxID=1944660 RepID=UPI0025E9C412|nr:PcfB family protein [Parvimonas sp.]MCI5997040.1 PcfB family protein [Parvimonas sp.]